MHDKCDIYLWMNYRYRLNATQHSKMHIGRTLDKVFENLLSLGKMYDLRINEAEFYIFDQVHEVLTQVYNDEEYPLTEILNSVNA